jgi:hypothetical protein
MNETAMTRRDMGMGGACDGLTVREGSQSVR